MAEIAATLGAEALFASAPGLAASAGGVASSGMGTLAVQEMAAAGSGWGATVTPGWASVAGGGASGPLSALQGTASAAQAVTQLFGGAAGYMSHKANASGLRLNADQEFIAAERQALEINRERLKKVGDSRVAFAGSGQLTSGAGDIEASLANQAEFETGLLRTNARLGAAGKRGQAISQDTAGYASLLQGGTKALATKADYALDLRRRG